MRSVLVVTFIFSIFLNLYSCKSVQPASTAQDSNSIIEVAETFFTSLQRKDFQKVWDCLTEKSKNRLIADILKYYKDSNFDLRSTLESEFKTGSGASIQFWENYIFNFDPNMALKESKWEIGKITGGYGELLLTHKNSQRPAILRFYKEANQWKFGLVESFWTRK